MAYTYQFQFAPGDVVTDGNWDAKILECRASSEGRSYRILWLDNLDPAERDAIDLEDDFRLRR